VADAETSTIELIFRAPSREATEMPKYQIDLLRGPLVVKSFDYEAPSAPGACAAANDWLETSVTYCGSYPRSDFASSRYNRDQRANRRRGLVYGKSLIGITKP
jgi:hypothetical protein